MDGLTVVRWLKGFGVALAVALAAGMMSFHPGDPTVVNLVYPTGGVKNLAGLPGADLTGADLEGAHLERADLRWTNLTHATNLTQAQLDQACVDEHTLLPEGLKRPKPCSEEDLER